VNEILFSFLVSHKQFTKKIDGFRHGFTFFLTVLAAKLAQRFEEVPIKIGNSLVIYGKYIFRSR
jgi:hypothetical protein